MPMSRSTLFASLAAGVVGATAVAYQRVGLALAAVLLLMLAAAVTAARAGGRRVSPGLLPLAGALAVQPVLRDAGWIVTVDAAAALVAGACATAPLASWRAVARSVVAPLRVTRAAAALGWALAARTPQVAGRDVAPVLRGLALAGALTAVFGGLLASADSAFAELASETIDVDADPGALLWRVTLGAGLAVGAAALARSPEPPADPDQRPRLLPGKTELRIALGALVALFCAFVIVQLHVLFGGAGYVRRTTGLGFGDYAREGFVQLVLVAVLTLAVVAGAARRRDRAVRLLLGALCGLTLVMLGSAWYRLDLVVDAYGLTRTRLAGETLLPWLAGAFALVLAAGAHPAVARAAPRVAVLGTLTAVLAFSLSNPDGRIAGRAVDRLAAQGTIDLRYLGGLSADATPALQRLPAVPRSVALAPIGRRLERADGVAGLNLSRTRAR